jgi:predicted nicotinamide N-methyase
MSSSPYGFVTVEEQVLVDDLVFVVTRPTSAEDLIDEEEYAADERLPYWADLWPSGRILADHLATREVRGMRIVELGAGLALPSLVAAARGATVVATDWYEPSLTFVRQNAERAGVAVETMLVDWRDPPPALVAEPFDLLIASDVLYEARNVAPLVSLVPRLLAKHGSAVIADPRRNDAGAFLDAMRADGWSHTRTDVQFNGRRDETGSTIHLHQLTRN